MKEEKLELLASANALAAALAAHDEGRLDLAETLYRRLLETHPDYADVARHFAMLMHQRGRRQEAIALIQRAIELDGHRPEWHNDLGNMLAADQQLEPARAAFMAAIELDPRHAEVWNNLGAILQRQQHLDEAEFSYRQALALNPEFVDAMSNLGNLLAIRGQPAESAEYLCRAFVTAADDATPKDLLGIAYSLLGRQDEAKEVYRRWLQEVPAHPIAGHLYAACSGVDVPLRASNAYIEMYFDDLAKSFDAKLLDNLDYQAPRLVGRMLARHASPERTMIGLDAGCGTGLCGAQISPYVERLTGIDLSSNMLAQARQKLVYDELVKTELTQFMHDNPAAFDLIVMADTLIYFGPLQTVVDAASIALRPGGFLICTVEAPLLAGDTYSIKPNGRYGHGREYLVAALQAREFEILEALPAAIRIELGRPVDGLIVTARLPGSRPAG